MIHTAELIFLSRVGDPKKTAKAVPFMQQLVGNMSLALGFSPSLEAMIDAQVIANQVRTVGIKQIDFIGKLGFGFPVPQAFREIKSTFAVNHTAICLATHTATIHTFADYFFRDYPAYHNDFLQVNLDPGKMLAFYMHEGEPWYVEVN